MKDPKEVAKLISADIFHRAIERGAKPLPILIELAELQTQIRMACGNNNLEFAVKLAEKTSRKAQTTRASLDEKWTIKFTQEGFRTNYLEDAEFLHDFANLYTLDRWLEAYGPKGDITQLLQEYASSKRNGEIRFIGPGLS